MRNLGYTIIRYWIAVSLFFYYRKTTVVGKKNIPRDKPVLLLSNHQNALLDILLIATNCSRKPWYLTRSDVFKKPILKSFFTYLQMLPVYRMRDGKANLGKNESTFTRCGALLNQNEAILLFPEANHSLKRRVRPLSKGFMRLIFKALEDEPNLDIHLVPIGQNYQRPSCFPDSAAIYYGKPIQVQTLLDDDEKMIIETIKNKVSVALQQLTTHIPEESTYEDVHQKLLRQQPDFTNPTAVNGAIASTAIKQRKATDTNFFSKLVSFLFVMGNLPMIWLWRRFLKPKVPELEFTDTFRFAFCALGFPFFYVIVMGILTYAFDAKTACLFILGHTVFNLLAVKFFLPTSYRQRK